MARRVTLDAMIPREDFRIQGEELVVELIRDFPINNLDENSPIRRQLRKPDFQRETNHWTPEQVVSFVESFVDSEVIPSLIFWKSPLFIFVIDGGHRLSALRAWIEDDYGDGPVSQRWYSGEISEEQKRVARYTRQLVETRVGRFSTLKSLVGSVSVSDSRQARRASLLFTRPVSLQWVTGTAEAAESSFYKINSQGTPLDDVEEMLIRNRDRPVAIAARAILRAGTGHKYWSSFGDDNQKSLEKVAGELFSLLFHPEIRDPLKTLDIPLGGAASPVDALSILVEFLLVSNALKTGIRAIDGYKADASGEETISVAKQGLKVLKRITGNSAGSLGLHPAVYFYNERGKHSRFLFLGMTELITKKLANNDTDFFRRFKEARKATEDFLIENKTLVGVLLQNMAKSQRISKMASLFDYLSSAFHQGLPVTAESAIHHLGARGKVYDVVAKHGATSFSDDTKSSLFIKTAIISALRCPICSGLLDPEKSVSYDHVERVRDGGKGDIENGQIVHPYCNTAMKN